MLHVALIFKKLKLLNINLIDVDEKMMALNFTAAFANIVLSIKFPAEDLKIVH